MDCMSVASVSEVCVDFLLWQLLLPSGDILIRCFACRDVDAAVA